MPTVAEAYRTAIAHHEAGHLTEAEALYRRILEVAPAYAGCLHRLGGLVLATGRPEEAIALVGRAVSIDNREPVYFNTLGNAHFALGQLVRAEALYRRALRLKSDYVGARYNLGNVLQARHRPEAARVEYQRVLSILPEHAEAHNNLGMVLLALDRPQEALPCFQRALAIRRDYADAHFNLGAALRELGRLPEAVARYRRAIQLRPESAEVHNSLGTALLEQGKLEEALAHLEQAIQFDPEYAEAHNNLGTALLDQGRFDEAAVRFERAIQLRPEYAEAHFNRAELPNVRLKSTDLVALEALLVDEQRLPPAKAPLIHFALAKALEESGNPARAFQHWLAGNTLKRSQIAYDEAATHDLFRRIVATFDQALCERAVVSVPVPVAPVPIFILGMPRSGSSLVEQILASHPQVQGGGELTTLVAVATGLTGGRDRPLAYPEDIPTLEEGEWRRLGERYRAGLPPLAAGKTHLTDKMPYNFLNIGLIRLILPEARILHTVRDPIDTCLSCFSKLFPFSQAFSYDLGELGRYYRGYQAVMDHWRSVLPVDAVLDVSYEAVVADLEGQARRLVAYCGLPWDDRCLEFHRTQRPVRTASAAQVRQPLFRSSLERWRRFEPWLGPLLQALNGPAAMPQEPRPGLRPPVWETMVARA